jgi:hypothetical protein
LSTASINAPHLGLRILYYRSFRLIATTPAAVARMKSMLAGQYGVPGLPIKPFDRWTMITALLAHADPAAARPDTATKRQYFNDYLENSALSEDWIEQSLGAV